MMSLEIRPVTPADTEALHVILEEARIFKCMHSDLGWGTDSFNMEEVNAIIKADDTFIATLNDRPAGSLQLVDRDPEIWGELKGNDDQALYIHRFATAATFRRTGVGQYMIDWACQQVIDAGRLQLRLDCNAHNPKLREYYERQSFWCVGETALAGYTAALHQRRV